MGRLTRILLPGFLLLGLYYALFGGRYSVFELRRAEQERVESEAELERLKVENDSLRIWADSLANDLRVLERFAREELGMTQANEVLYRFEATDTLAATADSAGVPGAF